MLQFCQMKSAQAGLSKLSTSALLLNGQPSYRTLIRTSSQKKWPKILYCSLPNNVARRGLLDSPKKSHIYVHMWLPFKIYISEKGWNVPFVLRNQLEARLLASPLKNIQLCQLALCTSSWTPPGQLIRWKKSGQDICAPFANCGDTFVRVLLLRSVRDVFFCPLASNVFFLRPFAGRKKTEMSHIAVWSKEISWKQGYRPVLQKHSTLPVGLMHFFLDTPWPVNSMKEIRPRYLRTIC